MIRKLNDNSWLLENESYLKNKKRRTKMAAIFIATALFIGTAVFFYVKSSDEREYMYGIEDYYDTLNKGSSYRNEITKQEIKDGTEDYLSSIGITGYTQWMDLLQKLDTRIMEAKYGNGFKVAYRIEKTEPLTEKELDDYRKNIATKAEYDKAYRVTIKEHFKGPKSEGYEKQHIIVSHTSENHWLFQEERLVELNHELDFLNTVWAHYFRLNTYSSAAAEANDYSFLEEDDIDYKREVSKLAKEYGEGFQIEFTLKDISPMTHNELTDLAELVGQDENHFIKGYKVDVIENFSSDKGENTCENTIFVPYEDESDFEVYDERWMDISD